MSLALPEALFFTGIDWAAATHAVCVMDAAGKITAEFTIAHSADGIATLIRRLARYGDPADMPVGIERPNGQLVDLLLEAGHPVVPVSPNAIKTWREGEVLSGAKSDAGDAAVIAEYLRLRQHRLRVAAPYSDQTKALRTVVRTRDDLVEMRVAATNQLSALLDAHWPGAKAIFADVESPVSLAFLTRYPTPAAPATSARSASPRSAPPGLLRQAAAAVLLARLRSRPGRNNRPGPDRGAARRRPGPGRRADGAEHRSQGPRPVRRRPPRGASGRRRSSRRCQGRVRSTPPRCSPSGATAAKPTTARRRRRPGRVHPRHQAVRQAPRRDLPLGLQQAVPPRDDHLRRQQPPRQPLGRQDLRRCPRRGKDHPHAIRILARAWIRVIWPCWLDGTPYDPARHGAAAALAEQAQQIAA